MTNLTDMTAKELAAYFNQKTGRSVKPTSYSKAKFIELIQAHVDETAPIEGDHFTLAEVARSLGINPKLARARFRKIFNDGRRTRYSFDKADYQKVVSIITPGPVAEDFKVPSTWKAAA